VTAVSCVISGGLALSNLSFTHRQVELCGAALFFSSSLLMPAGRPARANRTKVDYAAMEGIADHVFAAGIAGEEKDGEGKQRIGIARASLSFNCRVGVFWSFVD